MRNEGHRVVWQAAALRDLRSVFDYLLPLNPHAAESLAQELILAADSLETFPFRGRPGRVPGTRELAVIRPYILVYEVRAEEVAILRLWHGMQRPD